MAKTNKDKNPVIDESVLEETPPNINEPQNKDDDPENKEPDIDKEPEVTPKVTTPEKEPEVTEPKKEAPVETQEEKDARYKSQQTEAQIQAAKAEALKNKVKEASKLGEPTQEELTAYVASKGASWDELTPFEQSMAKETYLANKRFSLVEQGVQADDKIQEWANKVDEFIDSTTDKPEYIKLSSHEAEFRKFCMKEAHRGTPIETLLPAFLFNLPATAKKRGGLFETGGGGEAPEVKPGEITDADQVAALRTGTEAQQREYKRLVKSGKIKLEI